MSYQNSDKLRESVILNNLIIVLINDPDFHSEGLMGQHVALSVSPFGKQ